MTIKQCNWLFTLLFLPSILVGQNSNTPVDQIGQSPAVQAVQVPEDPIADRLQAEKFKYIGEVTAAFEKLVESIDSEIEKTKNSTKLSVEAQLKKLSELNTDRHNVVNGTNKKLLQKVSTTASAKYEKQVAAAKKTIDKAFERAAGQYRNPPVSDLKANTAKLRARLFDRNRVLEALNCGVCRVSFSICFVFVL